MKTVDRGAAFLDEVAPGWDERIDLDTLDLGSACNCVLGQLYRAEHPKLLSRDLAFGRKLRELGLSYAAARRLGFLAWGNAGYHNVTREWARIIRSRREAQS